MMVQVHARDSVSSDNSAYAGLRRSSGGVVGYAADFAAAGSDAESDLGSPAPSQVSFGLLGMSPVPSHSCLPRHPSWSEPCVAALSPPQLPIVNSLICAFASRAMLPPYALPLYALTPYALTPSYLFYGPCIVDDPNAAGRQLDIDEDEWSEDLYKRYEE